MKTTTSLKQPQELTYVITVAVPNNIVADFWSEFWPVVATFALIITAYALPHISNGLIPVSIGLFAAAVLSALYFIFKTFR